MKVRIGMALQALADRSYVPLGHELNTMGMSAHVDFTRLLVASGFACEMRVPDYKSRVRLEKFMVDMLKHILSRIQGVLLLLASSASAAEVTATYNSTSDVPVTSAGYSAAGNSVNVILNFAPAPGANLTVVKNTGLGFIQGNFSNLSQGQKVNLDFSGATYSFVANYFGGTGNDLVLQWAKTKAYAWGYNNSAQLGAGSTGDRSAPIPVVATGVLAGKTLLALANGSEFSLALCSDGTLAAWGANSAGQLGNGTTTASSVPVAVTTGSGVLAGKRAIAIAAGASHCVALCSDGTLATWGKGTYGALGNGGTSNSKVPVAVIMTGLLAGKSVTAISAGDGHSVALCADGTVVAWGAGYYGQLGNGDTNSSSVPVSVVSTGFLAGKSVSAIASGSDHVLAVCSDGTLAAWGRNYDGQLGNNTSIDSSVPIATVTSGVLSGKQIATAAGGYAQSGVLCTDGTLAAWGTNSYGQLGNASNSSSKVPVAVSRGGVLSGKSVTSLGGGESYFIVRCSDGSLATWGYNSAGQLGTGSLVDSNIPVAVVTSGIGAGEKFVAHARTSMAIHASAITAIPLSGNSSLSSLALESASLAPAFSPNVTNYDARVTPGAVTLTVTPTCADPEATVTVNGMPVVSGTSSAPILLTTGTPIEISVTAENGSTTLYSVTPKRDSSLAGLSLSAGVLSPGFSSYTTNYSATVPASTSGITVTPTVNDLLATVRVNGEIVPSGKASGSLPLVVGNNSINVVVTAVDLTSTNYVISVIRPAPLAFTFSSATAVAVTSAGYVAAGNSVDLALGFAPVTGTQLTVVNNTGSDFIQGEFTNLVHGQRIGLTYSGRIYEFLANFYGGTGNDLVLQWANTRVAGWGRDGDGEIGIAGVQSSNVPIKVGVAGALVGKSVFALASGLQHSLALCSDGSLAAWGLNQNGQLGNNSTTGSKIPVPVSTSGVLLGKTIIGMAAGGSHNLAFCADGTLAAWGGNSRGQLGDGSTTQNNKPVAVTRTGVLAGRTVTAVAAGGSHSLALCSDGTLAAWGLNSSGQLGNGSTTQSTVPVLVDRTGVLAGRTIVAIAAGSSHSLALCADGTLVSWGGNTYGQLGDNSTVVKTTPVIVDRSGVLAGRTVVAIASGGNHVLARCSDGNLAAWGFGQAGQLGTNAFVYQSLVPVLVYRSGVLAGKTLAAVAGGDTHSLAMCADGTAAAWGDNKHGGLGNASTINTQAPVTVMAGEFSAGDRIISVAAGSYYSLALIASPPSALAVTLPATALNDTSVALNGSVNANGTSTTVEFEYGLTSEYGNVVAANPASVTGSASTTVSLTAGDLQPGTTYHFRVVARNVNGTIAGNDMTFTTTDAASLAGLICDGATLVPAFSSSVTRYLATVPYGTSTVTLTPVMNQTGDIVTVNGNPVASGGAVARINLSVGGNDVTTIVTAAGGGNLRTYALTITRLPQTLDFNSLTSAPVSAQNFAATGLAPVAALKFAPPAGSILTVVRNTGFKPVEGTFGNLAQGQRVDLTYQQVIYPFVVNYFGGDGNDLVLQGAGTQAVCWGSNTHGQLGTGNLAQAAVATMADRSGVLANQAILQVAAGTNPFGTPTNDNGVVVCADGGVVTWGSGTYGQLGSGSLAQSNVPVAVVRTGALAGKTVVAVAMGASHMLALCADGTLVAWGRNNYGQLGNNSSVDSQVPVMVNRSGALAGKRIMAVAAGSNHSLALCSDGTLVTWGDNLYGQLGNSGVDQTSVPVAVDRSGGLVGKTVIGINARIYNSFAVCADGTVVGWGSNSSGQLGGVTLSGQSNTPVQVSVSGVLAGRKIVRLATSGSHCLALCADGALAAWGGNSDGQLGNNSLVGGSSPVLVGKSGALAGKTIVDVAAGANHSLALCSDGTIAAWGDNLNSQLGNNTQTDSLIPVAVSMSQLVSGLRFTAVAGGGNSSLSLVAAPPPSAVTMAANERTGTSVTLQGQVNAYGIPAVVIFEYGPTSSYGATVGGNPASVSGGTAVAVSAKLGGLTPGTTYHYRVAASGDAGGVRGTDMTFTTLSDNAKLASLNQAGGELVPGFDKLTTSYVVTVPHATTSVTLVPVVDHPAATLKVNGTPVSSGATSGAINLAVGNTTIHTVVTAEDGITTKTYSVTVTRLPSSFVFNTKSDVPVVSNEFSTGGYPVSIGLGFAPQPGTVLTMVRNTGLGFIAGVFGNLAQGERVTLSFGGTSYDFVVNYFGGSGNDLVLQWAETDLFGWGANAYGQLGMAPVAKILVPTPVDDSGVLAGKTLLAVSSGYLHSLALCSDGSLASWGYNVYGQLGNNGSHNSEVPVAVDRGGALAGKTVVAISSGPFHNLVLCSDGTVAAWGYNNYGQLGTGDKVTSRVPVRVKPLGALSGKSVVAVAAGAYQSFARCSDGTVAAWGYNDEGELGDGSTITSSVPVSVDASGSLSGKKVAAIAAGQYHTLALCSDGTLHAWGYNKNGQLGNNSTVSSMAPVAIGASGSLAGLSIISLSAGASHSLALCSDASLVGWGSNSKGQLGSLGLAQSVVPVLVDLAGVSGVDSSSRITAGSNHCLLSGSDAGLHGWGENSNGQLGNNSSVSSSSPVPWDAGGFEPGMRLMSAASGISSQHSLAIMARAVSVSSSAGVTEPSSRSAATGSSDSDQDGIPDLVEYAFGSDPQQAGAGNLPQASWKDGSMEIRFVQPQGVTGVVYSAEWTASLKDGEWTEIPDSGTGTEHVFRLPGQGRDRCFMRLKVTKP